MVRRLLSLTAFAAAAVVVVVAAPLAGAPAGPGAFKITGVAVDVVAGNATQARSAAYTLAERRAWPQLWARITGKPIADAPHLSDSAIEALVAGVEIEREQFSLIRYIGRLAIIFDRDRASGMLGGIGGEASPMLLLPVISDGAGVRTVYQAKTPWSAAWLRFRDAASALDYVIPAANAGDNVVLNVFQSRRHDRTLWRAILARFKAADVLTAEVRLDRAWPGGPVTATVVARHGPDATELGRFTLHTANPAGIDAMLDEAVRQVDGVYLRALQTGALIVERGLTLELAAPIGEAPAIGPIGAAPAGGVTEAAVATPNARTWSATAAELRAVPGVSGVTLVRLVLGGVSRVALRSDDDAATLAYHLDQRGWRLIADGGGVLLRRKLPGDPAVPPPPSVADLAGAETVDEPDAAASARAAVEGPAPATGHEPAVPGVPAARRSLAVPGAPPASRKTASSADATPRSAPLHDLPPPAARDPLAPR